MKHGEGKKWYLEAKNYSEDLLNDIRRQKFIKEFFTETEKLKTDAERLERLDKAPWFIKHFIRWRLGNYHKKNHLGQVVPIEDIKRIFEFTNSIVRVTCLCRHITHGKEKGCCYGISMGPNGGKFYELLQAENSGFFNGPDPKGLETVSREEAFAAFKEHELEGLCHTVWTFVSPFIGGICNCDRPDCLAVKATINHGIRSVLRAEYVAERNPDLCSGCRQCMRACQFGSISYSAASKKVIIDQRLCYGCGICRAVCEKDAITLKDRATVPAVANMW
jgi:Pyruvate/2-oxoacid:ferredoxin oxidoreductase delta subunit